MIYVEILKVINAVVIKIEKSPKRNITWALLSYRWLRFENSIIDIKERKHADIKEIIEKKVASSIIVVFCNFKTFTDEKTAKQIPKRVAEVESICGEVKVSFVSTMLF